MMCCCSVQGSEHEDYVMEMIDREADGSDSLEVNLLLCMDRLLYSRMHDMIIRDLYLRIRLLEELVPVWAPSC
jgi:hypothetical protein